jgi:hypothetical protein
LENKVWAKQEIVNEQETKNASSIKGFYMYEMGELIKRHNRRRLAKRRRLIIKRRRLIGASLNKSFTLY